MKYVDVFWNATVGYADWLWKSITFQYEETLWGNYFWMLIIISIIFFSLEYIRPWRKTQALFRKDFWLDTFYMFFNFFIFGLIGFIGLSEVAVDLFNKLLNTINIENLVAIEIATWPVWIQLLVMFIIVDFVQWAVHVMLHKVPFLWEFHKVHHSVKEMGFAAHLRYHWMETIVYKSITYIPVAMIGFGIDDFFLIHIIAIVIGHWNHANFSFNIGPLKYIFNHPNMHIWHHAMDLPDSHPNGINFGISLSIWDWIFGTAKIPHHGRDIKLGFKGDENFPKSFTGQITHGFKKQA